MRQLSIAFALLLALPACDGGEPDEDSATDDSGVVDDTDDGDTDDVDDTDTEDTDDTDDTDTGPSAEPLVGYISPVSPIVLVGAKAKLQARTWWTDNSSVTAPTVTWSTPSGSGGQVDAGGNLLGTEVGWVWVTADFNGDEHMVQAYVRDANDSVVATVVKPSTLSLGVGEEAVLTAEATLASGIRGDVAASCAWSSSAPSIAIVGASGGVTAIAEGEVTIVADCPDFLNLKAELTVTAAPDTTPAALAITGLSASSSGGGLVDWSVQIANSGGASTPVPLELYDDGGSTEGAGIAAVMLPALAGSQEATLHFQTLFDGARPATITPSASLHTTDTDTSDNSRSSGTLDLAGDLSADLALSTPYGFAFGPGEAGVSFSLTNNGPEDLSNITVYWDKDKPGATSVTDFDAGTSEVQIAVTSIASGETQEHAFDFDDAPFGSSWHHCVWVLVDGVADPDLSNNFACNDWSEF